MKIAVITGASSGIGQEFVRSLDKAAQFDEIWLIARRLERLEALALETRAKARLISLDLTKEESIAVYAQLLEAHMPEIAVLVNASGFGKFKAFEWEATEIDGHDTDALKEALSKRPHGKPYAVIADTVKGHGVSLFEKSPAVWHEKNISDEDYALIMEELS